MKASLPIAVFCTVTVILMSGCSGASDVEIDISQVADRLLESGIFTGNMLENDDYAGDLCLYESDSSASVSDVAASEYYTALGTSADMFILIECADETAANRLTASLHKLLENKRSAAEFYFPDEVFKLDNAVIISNGVYLAAAVTENFDSASAFLGDIFGGELSSVDYSSTEKISTNGNISYESADEYTPSPIYSDYEEKYGLPEITNSSAQEIVVSDEEISSARQAAFEYYSSTVYEVGRIEFNKAKSDGSVVFTVYTIINGSENENQRTIELCQSSGNWIVTNEGY